MLPQRKGWQTRAPHSPGQRHPFDPVPAPGHPHHKTALFQGEPEAVAAAPPSWETKPRQEARAAACTGSSEPSRTHALPPPFACLSAAGFILLSRSFQRTQSSMKNQRQAELPSLPQEVFCLTFTRVTEEQDTQEGKQGLEWGDIPLLGSRGADISKLDRVDLTPQLSMPGDLQGLRNHFLQFTDSLKGAFLSPRARRGQGHAGRALPLAVKGQHWRNRVPCTSHLSQETAPCPCPQRGSSRTPGTPSPAGTRQAGAGRAPHGAALPGLGTVSGPVTATCPLPRPAQALGGGSATAGEDPNRNPGSAPLTGFSSSELLEDAAATGPGARCLSRTPGPPHPRHGPGPHL